MPDARQASVSCSLIFCHPTTVYADEWHHAGLWAWDRGYGEALMRVAHLLPNFPYFGDRQVIGGYASSVLALADAQSNSGDEVMIIARTLSGTPGHSRAGAVIHSLGDTARDAGSPWRTVIFLADATLACWRRRRDMDVIHVHCGFAEYAILGLLCRLVFRRRVVVSVYCPVAPGGLRRLLQRLAIRCVPRNVLLTGMSDNVSRSIEALAPERDITPLAPTVDLAYWSTPTRSKSPDLLRLLFVGNASPEKGLDDLLEAVSILRNYEFDFMLTVTTELPRSSSSSRLALLRERRRDFDLEDCVEFTGVVDNMKELLASCDVHVAPFRSTQGPSDYFMSSLEAMASGAAVIVSDLPGMAEIIEDGHSGIVVRAGDPQSIADGISRCSDPAVRRKCALNAFEIVRERFDLNVAVDSARKVYSRGGER